MGSAALGLPTLLASARVGGSYAAPAVIVALVQGFDQRCKREFLNQIIGPLEQFHRCQMSTIIVADERGIPR